MLLLSLVLTALVATFSTGFILVDIQREEAPVDLVQHDRRHLDERQIAQILDNLRSLYFANITLGTPPQKLRMHVDTGSSDLWCNSPESTLCSTRFNKCAISGTYASSASSTYELVGSNFSISYQDGTGARGDYVTDTIGIGGMTIADFQFGVGTRSTSTEGILGIGYPINEAQVRRGGGRPYDNLPQRMAKDGLIKSNAYSLWLNDLDANAGQILFGAINTDKYHGSLQTVPILKTAGEYSGLVIALSGMSLDGVNISSSTLPAAVLLDTGSTLTYLPNDITRSLYQRLHALPDTSSSTVLAYVPCALAQAERSLDFSFSGIKISVPFNELVLPSKGSDGSGLRFHDGTPACLLGIAPNGGGASVLGDSFLRSAYVVYDLANNQVSLAQTNFNATADHYKVIEAGPGGVPDATLVPNPVTDVKGVVAAGGVRLRVLARPTGAGGLLP